MNVIGNLLSDHLIDTLGWTLVHSLWQGALVALGAALLLVFMRSFRPQTRYLVGVMALLLMFGMSVVTFVGLYRSGLQENTRTAYAVQPTAVTAAGESTAAENQQSGASLFTTVTTFFRDYFRRHLPLIVTVWLLGMLVLVLKFLGGFLYNMRLKTQHNRPLPGTWQKRMQELCRKTGISRPVRLLESALARVPMVVGYLKPVVLVPVGMVGGLPASQVEALLAHELAHIARKDYLVNMLQQVVDILYFYHPGVRWLSSFVRSERENCCDDFAVSSAADSLTYAKALTNVQELAGNSPEPALAITGKTPRLLNRVKRLLKPVKKGSQFTEGFVGACIMLLCIFTLVVGANAAAAVNTDTQYLIPGSSEKAAVQSSEKDKEKKKEEEKLKKKEEEKKKSKEELKRAKELKLKELKLKKAMELKKAQMAEEARVLDEDSARRQKLLEKKEAELAMQTEKMRQEDIRIREELEKLKAKSAAKAKELDKEEQAMREIELKRMKVELAKRTEELKKEEERMAKKLKLMEENLARDAKKMAADEQARREKELQLLQEKMSKRIKAMKYDRARMEKQLQHMQQEMAIKSVELKYEKARKEKHMQQLKEELAMKAKALKYKQARLEKEQQKLKEYEAAVKKLTTQLLKDMLIDDEEEFEFKLTVKALYINGVKQPASVYNKYKKLVESRWGKIEKKKSFMIRQTK
jgi:beta-lactamase regulating signal transducer with metallopeptidase domain